MVTDTSYSIKNKWMTLITKAQMTKLLKGGSKSMTPVIKLFMANITWYVTGIDDGILYGYGDLGQGIVEYGSLTTIAELPTIRHRFGYMERDRYFKPNKKLKGEDYLAMKSLS
jgi:hypothetical protein